VCYHSLDGVVHVSKRSIELQVYPSFRFQVPTPWLRHVVSEALAAADPEGERGASVVVADDATLRELNGRYLGEDQPTDVLAFPWEEPGPASETPPFPAPRSGGSPLGEVLVSYPQALRQAHEHEQPLEREVALLVIHGLLHLLGHDHTEPEEEAAMRKMEREALAKVFASPSPSAG
jgi:probable rRNA maturation factor